MIDNRFYESLKLDNKIIMVEHATVLCEISDVHKRTLLNVAKGSDWIWYKYKSRKRPIICIDNRIELGLLSSIEERYLLNTEDNEDLATILSYVLKAVAVFAKKEIKALFLTPELKEIYKHAMEVIQRQSSILYHVGDLEERYMLEIKDMLIQNITKLSSLIVDINIYNTIIGLGAAAQDIVLFVGAAHAHRLHKYFRDIFTNIGPNPLSAEDIKTLDKMVYENERVETAIINVLR